MPTCHLRVVGLPLTQVRRELRPVNSDDSVVVAPSDGYVWVESSNVTAGSNFDVKADNLGPEELLGSVLWCSCALGAAHLVCEDTRASCAFVATHTQIQWELHRYFYKRRHRCDQLLVCVRFCHFIVIMRFWVVCQYEVHSHLRMALC